jgi:hypothetical protein
MYVVCSHHPSEEKVAVMGRTDYPDCGDFKFFVFEKLAGPASMA